MKKTDEQSANEEGPFILLSKKDVIGSQEDMNRPDGWLYSLYFAFCATVIGCMILTVMKFWEWI